MNAVIRLGKQTKKVNNKLYKECPKRSPTVNMTLVKNGKPELLLSCNAGCTIAKIL